MCLRFGLKRDLVRYVDGELSPSAVTRIEEHLVDCASCRETALALRDGRSFARALTRIPSPSDRWDDIEAALVARVDPPRARWTPAVPRLTVSVSRWALAGWVIAATVLCVNGWFLFGPRTLTHGAPQLAVESGPVDKDGFQTVSVSDIKANTRPHVVAEGKVAEVRIDEEDGDLMFKLVDELGEQDQFIICEVIDPIHIDPPAVGSKVRVYGVSRFDPQADHNWFEIHPVLSIEQIAR